MTYFRAYFLLIWGVGVVQIVFTCWKIPSPVFSLSDRFEERIGVSHDKEHPNYIVMNALRHALPCLMLLTQTYYLCTQK